MLSDIMIQSLYINSFHNYIDCILFFSFIELDIFNDFLVIHSNLLG